MMNDGDRTKRARGWGGLSLAVALVLLTAVLGACTNPARFTPASSSQNFPPYEGEVRVLENLPNSSQYQRVGVVIVEGVLLTKDASMVDAVKNEAADNGANAVVMQSAIKVTKNSDGSTRRTLAAWAIRLNK